MKRKRRRSLDKSPVINVKQALPVDGLKLRVAQALAKARTLHPSQNEEPQNPSAAARKPSPPEKVAVSDHQVSVLLVFLPEKTISELRQLWLNALRYAEGATSTELSRPIRRLLQGIENEWSIREAVGSLDGEEYFAWPTTDAPLSKRKTGEFEVPGVGMLSYLEYHVGRTHGQSKKVRRAILDRMFVGKLPNVFERVYMVQWGDPGSARRLQKMAETIAALTRNFKRRDDDRLDQAIREWEDDLNYLFDQYYVGKFRFAWPITRLG